MAGILLSDPRPQFDLEDGTPAAGGNVYFYATGTSTPATTYSDADLDPSHENTNPVPLGADGRTETLVYLDPLVLYRVVVKDADGNTIPGLDVDPVAGGSVATAIEEHNADPDAHLDASETQRGMVELASDAEAIAKTRTDVALTPANLAAIGASKTFAGLVEQATNAETVTGTDDVRYTSPANIQALQATAAEIFTGTDATKFMGVLAFATNITVTGSPPELSAKFPGGVTFKAGKRTQTNDSDQAFTYAAAFATQTIAMGISRIAANVATPLFPSSVSASGFNVDPDAGFSGPSDFFWWAVGQ